MLDPFFPPPQILVNAIQPIAEYFGLLTLPLHVHEVVFGWACNHLIFTSVSPAVSTWLFPTVYAQLTAPTTINWDIRVSSLIQSSVTTAFAFLVIWTDEKR